MIICGECGERNTENARFCQACAVFLEWDSEPAPQPQPAPTGAVADAGPAPQQPADVAARQWSRQPQASDRAPVPGDLICGRCGLPNVPTRKFCARCAAPLTEVAVVRIPWWRRLLARWRRRWVRRSGERPTRRRPPVRAALAAVIKVLRWVVVAALLLGMLGYALVPGIRSRVNPAAAGGWHKVTSAFSSRYLPVRPTGVTANRELPDHLAGKAIDTLNTTYWAAPAAGTVETILVLTFERPAQIRRAIIHNGAGQDFQNLHRARELHLVFSTGHTADVTLTDSPDPQTLDIPGGPEAVSVEIHLMSLYHAVQGQNVAITEVELFERGS